MILLNYDENNSGGSWWLGEEDYKKLKKAGWELKKAKKDGIGISNILNDKFQRECSKKFKTVKEGLEEFEKITGQDITVEGCNCCGAPHHFAWEENKEYQFCSGEGCLHYLYPNKKIPISLRESLRE